MMDISTPVIFRFASHEVQAKSRVLCFAISEMHPAAPLPHFPEQAFRV